MSHRLTFPPLPFTRVSPNLRTLMVIAAGIGLAAPALAQNVYTLKELVSPLEATSTQEWSADRLGANGDVLGTSAYITGYSWKWSGSWVRSANYAYKLPVWRNGGAPTFLPLPLGYTPLYGQNWGIDANGRVLSSIGSLFVPQAVTWWTGSTRTTWAPVPGFSTPLRWIWSPVTASGKVAAYTNTPAPRLAILSGKSTVQDIPLPPDPQFGAGKAIFGEASNNSYKRSVSMNDKGQVAVLSTSTDSAGNPAIKVWFWSGSAWTDITPPLAPSYVTGPGRLSDVEIMNVNALGEVAMTDHGEVRQADGHYDSQYYKYIWRPAGGLSSLPLDISNAPGGFLLADNGDALGTFPIQGAGQASPQWGAAIWRRGQLIDLNTLARTPDGSRLFEVQDVNGRGQILAVAGGTRRQYWLLTPQ